MHAKKKLLFIINPVSGVGRQKTVEKEVEKSLDRNRFEEQIVYTQYAHHATEISCSAIEQNFDAVIAVGGDGSINDVVNAVANTSIAIGIIPTGSGNGLARHLGVPLDIKKAIEIINRFCINTIDTVLLNGRVYASIAGIGFDAFVAKEMAKRKMRGLQAYSRIVLKNYPLYKSHTFLLDIDGKKIEREALFISFANSNQFGYNTAIAPTAQLDDGLMDVCIVQKVPFPSLPATMQLLYSNKFERSSYVEIIKASKATVFNNESKIANVDGECIELDAKLEFTVKPHSLRVIV